MPAGYGGWRARAEGTGQDFLSFSISDISDSECHRQGDRFGHQSWGSAAHRRGGAGFGMKRVEVLADQTPHYEDSSDRPISKKSATALQFSPYFPPIFAGSGIDGRYSVKA